MSFSSQLELADESNEGTDSENDNKTYSYNIDSNIFEKSNKLNDINNHGKSCFGQTKESSFNQSDKKLNKFQKSISIAQNRVFITQFKRELSSTKDQFLKNTHFFQVIMNRSRQMILKLLIGLFSSNHFSFSNSSFKSNDGTVINKYVNKIQKLKNTILNLKEQNNQLQLQINYSNDITYQKEIAAKDEYLNSIENEYKEQLYQMKTTIKEQKSKIKSFQDQKYYIIQLQTQLDNRNNEITFLKNENSIINQKLEQQIKHNSNAIDDIEFSFNKIEQNKIEIEKYHNINSQLQLQIDNLSSELNILKEKNITISKENKILKDDISFKENAIQISENAKNQLIAQIKEKNEIIDRIQNDISLLNVEKSLNKSSQVPTNNEEDIPKMQDSIQINLKTYQKMQIDIISLSSQIESQKSQIEEQKNLIQALRTNLQLNENELSLFHQNSQKDKSAIMKKEGQTISLKKEIVRLEGIIKQKEEFISQMLEADQKRTDELYRLQAALENSRSNIKRYESQNSEQLTEKFKQISDQLKESRLKTNKLDIILKQQKYRIQELQQENSELKEKLNRTIRDIKMITTEKDSIQEKFQTISITYTSNASKMQKVIDFVKNQNLKISEENSSYMKKNLELQDSLNSTIKTIDNLNSQISQLRSENANLDSKINFEYIPLKEDNIHLKSSIDKMKDHEMTLTKENQRLFTENESLKKEKETQKTIDASKIEESKEKIESIQAQNNEMKVELEKYRKIIQFILNAFNINSDSDIIKVIQKNQKICAKTKNNLEKISNEKRKIQSEIKLLKLKVKSQGNTIIKNEEKIGELIKELQEATGDKAFKSSNQENLAKDSTKQIFLTTDHSQKNP